MEAKLIVNPVAGGGRGEEILPKVIKSLKKEGVEVDVYISKMQGDAIKAAGEAARNYELVIVNGGDGTVNEVINGIIGSNTTLGIIPSGSINLFAREVGIPLNPLRACELIGKGEVKKIDLGKAGARYFLMMAGVGFDAHVIKEVEPSLKEIFGVAAFSIPLIKALLNYKPTKMSIQMDEELIRRKGYFVIISNISSYIPSLKVAPSARFDDGYLDVCILKQKGAIELLRCFVSFLLGKHKSFSDVEFFKVKRVAVSSENPVLVHTDCELIGTTPMDFSIVPKALSIILPKKEFSESRPN
jgi:YegS/Rv2252/BmrU family lipid kinase